MVNSVTEKFPMQPRGSYYTNFCTNENLMFSNAAKVNSLPQQASTVKPKGKTNALLPLSLLSSGGVLLYFGMRKYSAQTLFDRIINYQSSKIESGIFSFSLDVKSSMNNLVKKSVQYIDNFAKKRLVQPTEGLDIINGLNNPKRLILAQDVGLEAARNIDRLQYHKGASDIDEFGMFFDSISREESSALHHQRRLLALDLKDKVRVTTKNPEKNAELIEACENRLAETLDFRCDKADKLIETEIASTKKAMYLKMSGTMIEAKKRILELKMNIIDTTYAKMRQLLGVDDLYPSYNTIPDVSCISKLSSQQLKPTELPSRLDREALNNSYLNAIRSLDFNKLSDENLKHIFYSAGNDNNLQDLAFLIDRLRLRQVVGEIKNPDNVSNDDVIITKLRYLSARLNDYTKRELLTALGKDFDGAPMQKKRANVYYINRIAKLMGFNNIREVDKAMLSEFPEYASFNIRKYIKIFDENPDLYFS